jgi:hypothetical protein
MERWHLASSAPCGFQLYTQFLAVKCSGLLNPSNANSVLPDALSSRGGTCARQSRSYREFIPLPRP